jgi:hypothetical protein
VRKKFLIFISMFTWLYSPHVIIENVSAEDEISWRYHAQWRVDECTRAQLDAVYGQKRVNFDETGYPSPQGLSPTETKRWMRLYLLCMSDGCGFCDAEVGSCESGTCGFHNASCRPYLDLNGQPVCGQECADYAFTSMLPCSDPSGTTEQ